MSLQPGPGAAAPSFPGAFSSRTSPRQGSILRERFGGHGEGGGGSGGAFL